MVCIVVWTIRLTPQCSLVLAAALHLERKTLCQLLRALSDAATVIATALSPAVSTSSTHIASNSPAKVIESKSKLYMQLNELQNLKQSGVLTDEEYCEEKGTIMNLLQQLK